MVTLFASAGRLLALALWVLWLPAGRVLAYVLCALCFSAGRLLAYAPWVLYSSAGRLLAHAPCTRWCFKLSRGYFMRHYMHMDAMSSVNRFKNVTMGTVPNVTFRGR